MKKIILALIMLISIQGLFANIPAPQYRDEGNLDVIISGYGKLPSHTFFLLTREEDEEDQTQVLSYDPQKVRISYYKQTTVFLWAVDKETGVSTDTIILNDHEDDHTLSITGIRDNKLQLKYKFEKNSIPPILFTPYKGLWLLPATSITGLAILMIIIFVRRKRRARTHFA